MSRCPDRGAVDGVFAGIESNAGQCFGGRQDISPLLEPLRPTDLKIIWGNILTYPELGVAGSREVGRPSKIVLAA